MIPNHICTYYCVDGTHALRLLSTATADEARQGEAALYALYGIPLAIVGCMAAREADGAAWHRQLLADNRMAHTLFGAPMCPLPADAYTPYLLLVRETGGVYPDTVEYAPS